MKNQPLRKFVFALLTLVLGLLFTRSQAVQADMAPPPPPRGSDLFPSIGNTQVRMVSEYVLLDIAGYGSDPGGEARVTAEFVMLNQGDAVEKMRVRFPMNHTEYDFNSELTTREAFCEYSPRPALAGITVRVDDEKLDTEITYERMEDFTSPPDDNGNAVYVTVPCWAYFWITFPPGKEVHVKIAYTVAGYNYEGYGFEGYGGGGIEFAYVLGTGAGWADTIGKADIVARLPYDVDEMNISGCQPDDCTLAGKEVSWHYEDFEPDGNIYVRLIRPDLWLKILAERGNIQEDSGDGEAWGRLGKAYKEAATGAKGMFKLYSEQGAEFFDLSQDAYTKALELLPEDADWHYGYADLLCGRAMGYESTAEDWVVCVEQLEKTFALDPEHEGGWALLDEMSWWPDIVDLSGPEPDYLVLTLQPSMTPTAPPLPTSTPTQSPAPSKAEIATNTPASETAAENEIAASNTPTPDEAPPVATDQEPAPSPGDTGRNLPICGGSILGFFVIGAFVVSTRRKGAGF